MKTAFLISCSDHYSHRMHLWDSGLQSLGYRTRYITSDFDHNTKVQFTSSVPGAVQIPVMPYRKNLSVSRILSHRMFAKKVKKYLQQHKPDVVIALLPPNFLAHYLAQYKKKHPGTVLIFDIFDLWPESFPSNKLKSLLSPAFSVWGNLRDRNLSKADFITVECDLFRRKLCLPDAGSATVYLSAEPVPAVSAQLSSVTIELCYLGAINNIIDMDAICALLIDIHRHKPVRLHIIGVGEQADTFVQRARATGAEVEFHGAIYDTEKKQQILRRCHFGLNIMKSSVCVGLTMKSVDYFRFGLPIINNIPGDTAEMVKNRHIGLPIDNTCGQQIANMSPEQFLEMRSHVQALFDATFAEATLLKQIEELLKNIID